MTTAGAALGAGVYAYMQEEFKASEHIPIETAWEASQKSLNKLGFHTLKKEIRALSRKIIAQSADQEPVIIRLEEQTAQVTTFRIRVGTLGNEDVETLIYEHIKQSISNSPTEKL